MYYYYTENHNKHVLILVHCVILLVLINYNW